MFYDISLLQALSIELFRLIVICEVDVCLTKISPQRETVAGETRLSSAASNTTRVQGERGMFSPDSAQTVKPPGRGIFHITENYLICLTGT